MDGATFDRLSRRVASFGTRRAALKALAGAVVAVVAGGRTASAQSCTAQYRSCQSDGQCCAGAVCQSGMCQPGCRIDGVFRSASTPQPGNTCARCTPAVSTTTWSPANQGMSCWSGSAGLCGGPSTCQSGTCQPTNPVTCQPLTACHTAGECNPNTGLCSNPPAAAGTPCGVGEFCIGGFHTPGLTCNGNGACTGGQTVACAPYACGETSCRTDCEHDDHCVGGMVCRESECISLGANGAACAEDYQCASGHCVEGICCNSVCAGVCEGCETGVCTPLSSSSICGTEFCADDLLLAPVCGHGGACAGQTLIEECEPYRCDAAGTACRTTCGSDDDCVQGSSCGGGECQPLKCIRNLDAETPCSDDAECCSEICQGGLCVPTLAGTCDGQIGQELCGGGECHCWASAGDSTPLCVQPYDPAFFCAGDCSACTAFRTVCLDGSPWCGGSGTVVCIEACRPAPNECFTGGTLIAMADGTSRAIEDVRAGDYVLGMTGQANRVLEARTPRLGERSLYAFNGGRPFVTVSHPFLTEEGWKSLDPTASARFMGDVPVSLLRVGDRLRALAGVLVAAGGIGANRAVEEIGLESIELERIEAVDGSDPGTPIYTLVLDGDHTYFANDLIVHNK